ncbi:MAG: hypothetical protein WB341_00935 [Terracidiphilus sp.]
MPGSSFQSTADSQYLAAVERIDEMARLQAELEKRTGSGLIEVQETAIIVPQKD